VKYIAFGFLCERLGLYLTKEGICFGVTILVQGRVAILLHRMNSWDELQSIEDFMKSTRIHCQKIVRRFYRVVRKHFQLVLLQTPNESQFRILVLMFWQWQGIFYTIRRIDKSHNLVLALVVGGEEYYCRKFFHSTIIQRMIGPICM